jgi:DNA anti-recombination protein RmuC
MAQKDFNSIIGQIEEDLKKLQSAKEQVEKVVTDNAEFAKATSSLIDKTKSLLSDVKNLTADSLVKFAEQLTQTKTALDKLTSQTQASVKSSISSFDLTSASLTKSFSDKADEVAKKAKNTLEEQKTENLKTLCLILKTHNDIKLFIGQLLDLEIPETLKSINENLEGINNNLEKTNKDITNFRKKVADIETNNQKRFQTNKTLQITTLAFVEIFGIAILLKLAGVI